MPQKSKKPTGRYCCPSSSYTINYSVSTWRGTSHTRVTRRRLLWLEELADAWTMAIGPLVPIPLLSGLKCQSLVQLMSMRIITRSVSASTMCNPKDRLQGLIIVYREQPHLTLRLCNSLEWASVPAHPPAHFCSLLLRERSWSLTVTPPSNPMDLSTFNSAGQIVANPLNECCLISGARRAPAHMKIARAQSSVNPSPGRETRGEKCAPTQGLTNCTFSGHYGEHNARVGASHNKRTWRD